MQLQNTCEYLWMENTCGIWYFQPEFNLLEKIVKNRAEIDRCMDFGEFCKIDKDIYIMRIIMMLIIQVNNHFVSVYL